MHPVMAHFVPIVHWVDSLVVATRWFFGTLRFVFLLNCVNVSFLYVNNML